MPAGEGVQPRIQSRRPFPRITPARRHGQFTPAESAHAAEGTAQDEWDKAQIAYSVEKDAYGRYITTLDEPMEVTSIVDVFGNELTAEDYDVLYFNNDAQKTIVTKDNGIAGPGTYPTVAGSYVMLVIKGGQELPEFDADGKIGAYAAKIQNYTEKNIVMRQVGFTISPETTDSLKGVYAYEGSDMDDTEFKYDGAAMNVNFAVGDNQLTDTSRYAISWATSSTKIQVTNGTAIDNSTVKDAGTYTATIYDNQTGSKATVEVVVDPIDLSTDVVAIPTVNNDNGYKSFAATNITVNGNPLTADSSNPNGYVSYVATQLDKQDGTEYMPDLSADGATLGVYTFDVSASNVAGGNTNVVGGPATVTGCVVEDKVDFYYGPNASDDTLVSAVFTVSPVKTFTLSKGEMFVPSLLKAQVEDAGHAGEAADFDYTVTKDGQEVTSYTEPGEYVLTLDSPLTDNFATAGHEVVTFKVVEKELAALTAFAQVDGKSLSETFYYTGEAYVPTIAVVDKDGNKAVEGEDYAVAYKLDGKEVESMVDADEYQIVVSYADEKSTEIATFNFEIAKAPIVVAKADCDLYAWTGEAVSPTFTGNTKTDWTGLDLALTADNAVITYKKSLETDENGETNWEGTENTDWASVAAKDLKDVGTYQATVSVPGSNKNFQDATEKATAVFEISKTAAYADVAADAWYAESVYTAASEGFGYMTGIPGTNLFLPEGQITRAQVAQVLYNMAGGNLDPSQSYPTQFTDVEPDAWYAAPIFWASQAGIVTGIGDTGTFAPNDPVTREQVATMLWRYMRAQGKDVSGSADLAAYADGSSVSGWAAEAMAWAVDAEVFGVGTDVLRPQDDMSRAEMAATAVRVQPDGMIERA